MRGVGRVGASGVQSELREIGHAIAEKVLSSIYRRGSLREAENGVDARN